MPGIVPALLLTTLMIRETTCNNIEIILPKLDRCKISDDHTYTLILQNNYTKTLHILKVVDRIWIDQIHVCRNPLRFHFDICKPECLEPGEYTYYLCEYGNWNRLNVDTNNVKAASIKNRDEAVINGQCILIDGMVLVHHAITGILSSEGQAVINDGFGLVVSVNDHDLPEIAHLLTRLTILTNGIFKYSPCDLTLQGTAQPESESDNYIQYEG